MSYMKRVRAIAAKQRVRGSMRFALGRTGGGDIASSLPTGHRRVLVGLAADYGNLGDLAITRAQIDFLSERFPGATVIEVPISESLSELPALRQSLTPHDVVTLVGGGNTGDMYDDIQYLRELYLRYFPDTPVISFPQTVEFSDTAYGRWAAGRARRRYGKHQRLGLMARDTASLRKARAMFSDSPSELCPDVVLTLDRTQPLRARSGIVLSLRQDMESALSASERLAVGSVLGRLANVRMRDTHVGNVRLSRAAADQELDSIWDDFRSARLVVTDRLHGMIFAVITATPCVVLDSATGKVGGFYSDWLAEVPTVQLLGSAGATEIMSTASRLIDMVPPASAPLFRERFSSAFDRLWEQIEVATARG